MLAKYQAGRRTKPQALGLSSLGLFSVGIRLAVGAARLRCLVDKELILAAVLWQIVIGFPALGLTTGDCCRAALWPASVSGFRHGGRCSRRLVLYSGACCDCKPGLECKAKGEKEEESLSCLGCKCDTSKSKPPTGALGRQHRLYSTMHCASCQKPTPRQSATQHRTYS